jgi:hypothetical protein
VTPEKFRLACQIGVQESPLNGPTAAEVFEGKDRLLLALLLGRDQAETYSLWGAASVRFKAAFPGRKTQRATQH